MSLSLPSLLGQINRMMPRLGAMMQHTMQEQEEELMDLSPFHQQSMDPFSQEEHGDSSSEETESEEEEQEREFFPLTMSIGRGGGGSLGSFFGRKDEEDVMDPFLNSLFANINQQMGRIIQTIPKVLYITLFLFHCTVLLVLSPSKLQSQ